MTKKQLMEEIQALHSQISTLKSQDSKNIQELEICKASERRFRLMTDSLPVLISYVDSEHRYRFNNKTYEEWHGLSREEIYGKHVREILGEEAYRNILTYIEKALSGKKVSYEQLFNINAADRYLHVDYVPDIGGDDRVNGFFVLVYDITKRKKKEEALKQHATLSPREKEILQLVVGGKSSAEIADVVNLSPKTVETYRCRLMAKLKINNLAVLVRFAVENGLTSSGK